MQRDEVGAVARGERAAALDRLLGDLFAASGARVPGVALVATGGLGRRECAPCGDLDLMLVHSGLEVTAVADRIWYPIWDSKLALDHAVRTLPEALSLAIDDVRVALGLLDVRYVAGDEHLAAELRRAGLDQWRRTAGRAVVRLRAAV